jgi:hypothetical protein
MITEPGTLKLEDLFNQADVVALVQIVSGDAENYDEAVYKARVVRGLKGTSKKQTIFYGPFAGGKLGSEYIVFLRKTSKAISPKPMAKGGYGKIEYFEVFNQGYSAMASSYECVFGGSESREQCDEAVRICTDYVVLPKSIPTFPPREDNITFGCRWVRKQPFLQAIQWMAEQHGNKTSGIPGGI